jgi:hypothetical protein
VLGPPFPQTSNEAAATSTGAEPAASDPPTSEGASSGASSEDVVLEGGPVPGVGGAGSGSAHLEGSFATAGELAAAALNAGPAGVYYDPGGPDNAFMVRGKHYMTDNRKVRVGSVEGAPAA